MSKFFDILLTIQSRLTFISPSSEGPHKKIIPSQKPPSIRTIPIPHPYNAQLARCLSRGLSLQESADIIQLINHPHTLFNLSHFFKGYAPDFPTKSLARRKRRAFFVPEFRLRRVPRALNNNTKRSHIWPTETSSGRGNVPVARNPNPKSHKTPKSIHPQITR